MENRRIPSGLASLLAVSLLAAATAPRSNAETQDLKRKGADREDAGADPLADFFLNVGCCCAACESRRVPPAVAAEAEAQAPAQDPQQDTDAAAPRPSLVKALELLTAAEKELHQRAVITAVRSAGPTGSLSWQAAVTGLSSSIYAVRAFQEAAA